MESQRLGENIRQTPPPTEKKFQQGASVGISRENMSKLSPKEASRAISAVIKGKIGQDWVEASKAFTPGTKVQYGDKVLTVKSINKRGGVQLEEKKGEHNPIYLKLIEETDTPVE